MCATSHSAVAIHAPNRHGGLFSGSCDVRHGRCWKSLLIGGNVTPTSDLRVQTAMRISSLWATSHNDSRTCRRVFWHGLLATSTPAGVMASVEEAPVP